MVLSIDARDGRGSSEYREVMPLTGRNVMVVAGATGSGFNLVKRLHKLGAYVIPTTRNIEHFTKNVEPVLGNERVFPLVFDITSESQIDGALKTLKDRDLGITDCVISAAGGMESFSGNMGLALARIHRKVSVDDRPAELEKLLEDIRGWVNESRKAAMAVNYHGPRYLVHRLTNLLPRGGILVFDSSWWSSLYRSEIQVPPFYNAVAASKNLFEQELASRTPDLKSRGILTAVITGNLLIDTTIGKYFEKYLIPLLHEEERVKLKPFPTMSDMTKATEQLFRSDPACWPEVPRYLWVAGPGVILDSPPLEDAILKANFFQKLN